MDALTQDFIKRYGLDFKTRSYVQTKEVVKGKIVRIIQTGDTDQWGMALPKAEIQIEAGQRIIMDLKDLELQR